MIHQVYNKICSFKNLLVGFSGGIDSTSLLHILLKLKNSKKPELNIRAIHINHGLHNKANQWEKHCKTICMNWKIPFICRRVVIDQKNNIESNARKVRYQTYKKELLLNEIIVTAQHLNDQSETFILSLKRGSGPAGLSSIHEVFPFDIQNKTTFIIRPLLNIMRSDLENYIEKNNLNYIEDDSNNNIRFDRNYIRLYVMPLLHKRWPHFSKMVARSAYLCKEQELLIDELLQNKLTTLMNYDGAISIKGLLECSPQKRNALIRRWIKHHKIHVPSLKKLEIIWLEIALAKQNANPICYLDKIEIRRYQNFLWIVNYIKNLSKKCYNWNYPDTFKLPESLGILEIIKYGKIRPPFCYEKVTVRFDFKNKIKIFDKIYSKKIKKIWQEYKVAPWMRNRIPLIFYNETLITAVNYFITLEGISKNKEIGISINWKVLKWLII
ncbi:tRNA(Ile)-lysidine synthase [Candidatus Providencia siddallii]|uniref:tRNA(Ile)-lysidine synthase n=1 Tax=Candidatus Providencia siddallii TaxID=1715285 RepID=A0ABM9NNW8_9GAMM